MSSDFYVFTCSHILNQKKPILYVSHDADGRWQFLCGQVNHQTNDGKVIGMEEVLTIDPSLKGLSETLDFGWETLRKTEKDPWTAGKKLPWFTVKLALIGLTKEKSTKILNNFQAELKKRPHLDNPRVAWDEVAQRGIIEVSKEDSDPDSAGRGVQEEMLEALAAVLWETESLRFEIVEVRPL